MALVSKDNVGNSKTAVVPVTECDDALFKSPQTRAPKRKMTILDEESYTQDLENIIERDFFPDLPQMKAHLEYREALENNDIAKLRELRNRYRTRLDGSCRGTSISSEFGRSPATFETPVGGAEATPSAGETSSSENGANVGSGDAEQRSKRVPRCGLDSYLVSNTSEDNASFELIMEEADKKHRQRYAWLYDKEVEHAKFQEDALALPSAEEQATDRHRVPGLDTWTYTNKNYLMYVPDGAEFTTAEKQDLAVRQREIVYANSRFVRMPFNEQANREAISAAAQLQARAKEGKIGVDGKEVVSADEPQVNGYGFVVTPSPAPGVNESPLMTWGEIEGTPYRLDGKDSPMPHGKGPSFHIADVPARDKLAIELAEQVSRQHREKKQLALKAVKATLTSPSPRVSHVERLASMSPAAQRLASSRLGIHLGTDRSLRLSYTPTRSGGDGVHTPLSTPQKTLVQSPLVTKGKGAKKASDVEPSAVSSLTDNLLKLPKRSQALDFFQ